MSDFNMGSLKKGPPMGKQPVPKNELGMDEKAVMAMVKKALAAHEEGTKRDAIDTKEWIDSAKAEVQQMIGDVETKQKNLGMVGKRMLGEAWETLKRSMLGRYGDKYPLGDKRRQENGIALVKVVDSVLGEMFNPTL